MSVELRELSADTHPYPPAVDGLPLHLEMQAIREINYSILHTSRPVFDAHDSTVKNVVNAREVFFVIDRAIDHLYGKALRAHAADHLQVAGMLILDGDESHKTFHSAERICNAAIESRLSRTGIIIGVGGGVILDVSGFAASIYRRGIGYLRIPTTLIGQVDVSIGIKQAVNAGDFKNVLGSFYPPIASINDPGFLKTLPPAHIAAGCAEIIKMAVLADPELFSLLEKHGRALLASRFQESIAATIMMRAEASMLRELRGNLFETDLQRRVDFGHTFSVAMETDSAYGLSHGFAVGLDMLISTGLAVARGLCSKSLLDRLLMLYDQVELPITQNICSAQRLHDSLESVRKHRGGALNLVVPRDVGHTVFIQDVSKHELAQTLSALATARA